ncbi:MAG: hypothetical protein IJZ37_07125, partial [Clostridia bacterium]|nr:hypothetical protein [Clostridia bacterium]
SVRFKRGAFHEKQKAPLRVLKGWGSVKNSSPKNKKHTRFGCASTRYSLLNGLRQATRTTSDQ